MIEAINELLRDGSPLPACWEHGDFAPWNIKRSRDGGCALLDWEDARRKGLPLQDAYHFLHMQDWLFGGRPKLHATRLMDEAVAMGVPSTQICALEAAYLICSYRKCVLEGNRERASFVSRHARVAAEEKGMTAAIATPAGAGRQEQNWSELPPCKAASSVARLRTGLLNAFLEQMKAREFPTAC